MKKRTWKVSEIEGSEVFSLQGELLGKLVDVLPSGSNDIWVVRPGIPGGNEILIPALTGVIQEVDSENRKIVVDLPPGLKEIYEDSTKKTNNPE